MLHVFLHFLIPALITVLFFRSQWQLAFGLMMATMLVDLDHLLATPVYDPLRCSIGYHPLHRAIPIAFYGVMALLPKLPKIRLIGLGLLIHMTLDSIDCQLTNGIWYTA